MINLSFIHKELSALIEAFWENVNPPKGFPRNLESILWAHKLTLVPLENLDIRLVKEWLHDNHAVVPKSVRGQQRRIFGCLVAYSGSGYIFLDSNASEAEQRFTIAHEVGHFLRDYLLPRTQSISKMGEGIIEILDGKRSATLEERSHAILSSVHLYAYTDLLLRGENNQIISTQTNLSEDKADQIALELLAPHEIVLSVAHVKPFTYQKPELEQRIFPILSSVFGLPEQYANYYTKRLAIHFKKQNSVRDWLGL